jgi:hypothetical protein
MYSYVFSLAVITAVRTWFTLVREKCKWILRRIRKGDGRAMVSPGNVHPLAR